MRIIISELRINHEEHEEHEEFSSQGWSPYKVFMHLVVDLDGIRRKMCYSLPLGRPHYWSAFGFMEQDRRTWSIALSNEAGQ
jgi:hypothetical protein